MKGMNEMQWLLKFQYLYFFTQNVWITIWIIENCFYRYGVGTETFRIHFRRYKGVAVGFGPL